MKAAVYKEPHQPLVIENLPPPEPGPNEMVVEVKACGICGSDIHATEAEWTPRNIVLGHEFSGTVIELGEGVTNWSVGDRVVPMVDVYCGSCEACRNGDFKHCENAEIIGYSEKYPGAYSERLVVSAQNSLRLPDNIGFDEAAVVEPLAVGYDSVRRCKLTMEDGVLIVGAGPIGLSIAQWCRHFGVTDIAVSELNDSRLALAKQMGATITIDGNAVSNPAEEFERITGKPPTVIVEAVGVPGMIQRCIDMAAINTRIVVVGVCMGKDAIEPMTCIQKRIQLIFAFGYSVEDFATIINLMAQGRIIAGPLISHRIGLDELPEMFERMRKPTDQIKVIVKP